MSEPRSALQQEIKQSRPFASKRQEALLGILRTADVLRRRVGQTLDPFGVTPQQYNILRILRGAGEAGLPTLTIGERLIEETPGMTRLLDRMEAKKLVRRQRCKQDRRQVLCTITGEGLALLSEIDGSIEGGEDALRILTRGETDVLIGLLDKVRAAQ